MRLLIISHMPHHLRDGQVVGWGATVREIDQIATRFDSVRHIACLHEAAAPASDIAYEASNVELVPVPPSGSPGIRGKFGVLRASPRYVRAMLRELPRADMVHVRGPAHIALLAMLLLSLRQRPTARWFKYAGNWRPEEPDSPSYTFQRWWLGHGWQRGLVTINGEWEAQPSWVRTFYNPSLSTADLDRGRRAAGKKRLSTPLKLLFVGALEPAKGAGRALQILELLLRRGLDVELELIGDGSERVALEARASSAALASRVIFRGWQPPVAVYEAYARAHVQLLPSRSEGWPKVLSEGMAYGVVPVASAVSSIPQYIAEMKIGATAEVDDLEEFARAIARYVAEPDQWATESARAVDAASRFSFSHYLSSLDAMLAELGVAPRTY